jgi:putative hydrolase of the HAD superfamily
MTAAPIELVCFDLGRVLVRICDGWQQACDVAGVPRPCNDLSPAARAQMMALISRIEIGEGGEAGIDNFCREAARHLGVSCEHVAKVWRIWTLGPYEGAPELVTELAAANVPTACLSNTNIQHWVIMNDPADPHYPALAGLRHRFASHLIGARKPDQAAYVHVERETGVAPQRILFFDDVPENVEAARRRGWRGHVVERCVNPVPLIRQMLRDEGVL